MEREPPNTRLKLAAPVRRLTYDSVLGVFPHRVSNSGLRILVRDSTIRPFADVPHAVTFLMHAFGLALLALVASGAPGGPRAGGSVGDGLQVPVVDHHKHMPSPAAAALRGNGALGVVAIGADQLIAELDAAGLRRAVVLSVAYWFDSPSFEPLEDEYAKVRAENDWTAQQASRFPDRLVPFCSFNPLRDYALEELERCARQLHMRGLKLHFSSSRVDLRNAAHVEKVRRVFRAANERRLPIVVHVRGNLRIYGRDHAAVFLNDILPAALDVPVQIAHLWGGEAFSDSAVAVYAAAVSANDARTQNLYFDIADIVRWVNRSEADQRRVAERIRQIGPARILWGSDLSPPNPPAQEAWVAFRTTVPLTDEELRRIASNLAPYLR